ncbi:hypothetical protein ACJX0J_036506, partial [Zea mays]
HSILIHFNPSKRKKTEEINCDSLYLIATAWVYIRTFHGYIKIDIDTENQRNRRFSLTTTKLLCTDADELYILQEKLGHDIIFAGVMLQDARHAEKYMKIHDPFEIHNMRGNKFNLIINVYEDHILAVASFL